MADVRDDALHPLLSRGRPLSQVRIDALERGAGRPRYGAVAVQEVEARSALTDFRMGRPDGPPTWSLNPYAGCQHACAYCYVPKTLHAQRERWGTYVLVKKNLPTVLQRELARREPARVQVGTGTDAYQPVEREHRVTRACLEVLLRHDWPVDVLTRSPLVARDLDLLSRFTDARVGLTVPTLDDALRAAVEPAAPPVEARLHALQAVADAGIPAYANLAPAYPLTRGITPAFVVQTLKDMGARWVNWSPWKYRRETLPVIKRRLRESGDEDLVAFIDDDGWQRQTGAAFRVAAERIRLPLRHGFFNPPDAHEIQSSA